MQILPYSSPEREQNTLATHTTIDVPAGKGYAPVVPPTALDFSSLLDVFARRWLWIVAPIVIAIVVGVFRTSTLVPMYQASAAIDIREPVDNRDPESLGAVEKIEETAANRTVGNQVRLLRSPNLRRDAMATLPEELQRTGMRGVKVSVDEVVQDEAIIVKVTAMTPRAAAALANALVDTLIKNDLEESRKTETAALAYIKGQMTTVGADLRVARREMVNFKVAHEVSGTNEVIDQSIDRLTRLREEAAQAERSAAVANNLRRALAARLKNENRVVMSEQTERKNPLLDKMDAYIDDLETQRLELRSEFAADAPEVKQIDDKIRDARARRANLPETQQSESTRSVNPVYQQLNQQYVTAVSDAQVQQAQFAAYQREIARISAKLKNTAPDEVQSIDMVNRVQQLEEAYEKLSRNYQSLQLNAASKISNISVLSQAVENDKPVNRNMARALVLSLAVGILLAIALTMMAEMLDRRIHTERSLENIVYRPVLAQIPQMQPTGIQLTGNALETSPVLEQMRMLRNILLRAQSDAGYRIFGITSSGVREGKSTTALNLAITMALDGKRVILVDADLRRPTQHTMLGLSNEKGLTSVLSGKDTLEEALLTVPIQQITLLPAGPPALNSPELLSSPETHRLLKQLAERADIVIVDTPPASGLSDVLSLTPAIDGLLLVVSASQTNRDALQVTLRNLEQGGATVLGFVYNRAKLSSSIYKSYYYYTHDDASHASTAREASAESTVKEDNRKL